MSADLLAETEEREPKKAPRTILQQELQEGLGALQRPTLSLFLSGLSAGLDVGFSLFLMAVVTTMAGDLPKPVVALLVANMYSVGFIFVVLGRSELFTEQTTLAVLPVLSGHASARALGRLWSIVYVANLLGGAIFALLAVLTGPTLGAIEPQAFGEIARRMTQHPAGAIFLSGILAGWLMGLLSWLVAAGRDTISQVFLVWLITASIGLAGLHHAVLGSVEVMAGYFAGQGITLADAGHFLLWTTLGNIIGGGVFVAVVKYGHARPVAGEG